MPNPLPCLSCGKPMDEAASRCPHCGNARTAADAWWMQPEPAPQPEAWWTAAPVPPPLPLPEAPMEPPATRPLPPWIVGAGLAGIAGIAVLAAVTALPRLADAPSSPSPTSSCIPPPVTPRISWPTGEPLLARFAMPWNAKELLVGLPAERKPVVVLKPVGPRPLGPIVVKRMRGIDENALRQEAEATPEVALYEAFSRKEGARIGKTGKLPPDRLRKLAALAGLPFRKEAEMGPNEASVLMQRRMAQPEAERATLIDELALLEGKTATTALARRALFDTHPRLRERAIRALEKRPAGDWLPVLLKGFRHPWPAVAEHAAEALAALRRAEAVPALLAALQRPDPLAPFDKPGKGPHVREMVRLNHARNCLLCHAPATGPAGKVRAPCPATDTAMKPSGAFARVDTVLLRQDFALMLPVEKPGLWPARQQFDFVVRERPARKGETAPAEPTRHQKALLFALRELTGQDAGPAPADWAKVFFGRELKAQPWHTGFRSARALALRDGKAYVVDGGRLWLKDGDARPEPLLKDEAGITSLAFDSAGRLLAACGKTRQLLALDLAARTEKIVSTGPGRERFGSPARLAFDPAGGCWLADGTSAYHVSAAGSVVRLVLPLSRPRVLAVSPDGKTLAVAATGEVWLFAVEGAGLLGKRRRLVKLPGTLADLALHARGLLCALDASANTVEVVSPEGHRLALARLPDTPVACALAGKTLTVLTRTSLLTLDLGTVLP